MTNVGVGVEGEWETTFGDASVNLCAAAVAGAVADW